jgi:hypothetical protein
MRGTGRRQRYSPSVDRLFQPLSTYEIVGLVIPGSLAVAGVYLALFGLPGDVSATAALGLVLVFYVAGHLVQALTGIWRLSQLWTRRPKQWRLRPSKTPEPYRTEQLVDAGGNPYGAELMGLLSRNVARRGWPPLEDEPRAQLVTLVRAQLRHETADVRAESLLSMYFLSDGLAAASFVVFLVCSADAIAECDWRRAVGAAGAVLALLLFNRRRSEYNRRYADHVWADFAVLPD